MDPSGKQFFFVGAILKGCHYEGIPRSLTFAALPPLLVAFIMFAMTFYKCLTSLRMGVAARMPIMSVFLRDGVFWFLAALIILGAAVGSRCVQREGLVEVTSLPNIVAFSMISSRALLNIKRVMDPKTTSLESHFDSTDPDQPLITFRLPDDVRARNDRAGSSSTLMA